MMRTYVVSAVLLLAATSASAQIETCTFFARQIDAMASAPDVSAPVQSFFDPGQGTRCYAQVFAEQLSFDHFVKRFERLRTDRQTSSGSHTGGSTSVVAQGPAAKVLSVAAEYGALTQDVNGQVVTLRGNLAGLPSALVKYDVFPYCVGAEASNQYCVSGSLLSFLRRFSFSASFDASRDHQTTTAGSSTDGSVQAPQTITLTATRNEISTLSGRVELWNRRDVTSKQFVEKWKAKIPATLDTVSQDLLQTAGTFFDELDQADAFRKWKAEQMPKVRQAADTHDRVQIVAAVRAALMDLQARVRSMPTLPDEAEAALSAYSKFFLEQQTLIDSLNTTVVSFEYANNRPPSQPATTSLRLIADVPTPNKTKVVFNGSLTLYDDPSAVAATGATRVRDAQIAAEVDRSLGAFALTGPVVLSVAGYFQYQNSPSVLTVDPLNPVPGVTFVGLPSNAKQVFAKTGNIVLGQAKVTITPPGSSVKIPASLTVSNRTELIDKPSWKAQIGVTYDFDGLFAGLR